MAKKLYMTTADYLVIAVSPALIMAMVGSLVYFLIEVFYEGDYAARLDYAFGLFVFAAVLVARISIEEGREYAALFALPLGGAMYLVLLKFAEHPSPFSWLINLVLMCLVWWCADRLTWDSTVIDDDEDASGEGLMQRIGVDGPAKEESKKPKPTTVAPTGEKENELFEAQAASGSGLWQWLKRLVMGKRGPHTPGVWVFYFSLGALPLFGLGQYWIPSTDTGRRRYAFSLLLVYVASALALLVTTSFLNLRRYLRQRRIEMPLPIAGTWVGVGASLIGIVMLLAMMIPRPAAEVAISRVPWHVGSPGGMSASRANVNRGGGEKQDGEQSAMAGEKTAEQGPASQPPNGQPSESKAPGVEGKESTDNGQGKSAPSSARGKDGQSQEGAKGEESSKGAAQQAKQSTDKKEAVDKAEQSQAPPAKKSDEKRSESKGNSSPTVAALKKPLEIVQNVANTFRGWGLLKWLFYIVAGAFLLVAIWKHRVQILQAISDILRMLRELFGGRRAGDGEAEDEKAAAKPRPRGFSEFCDPFATGQHGQISPEELVRYTFAAFEAWANDRGRPRSPDCTPLELLDIAVEPKTPLHTEARKLVRLYGEVAYASRRVPRAAADELREVWRLMRTAQTVEMSGAGR